MGVTGIGCFGHLEISEYAFLMTPWDKKGFYSVDLEVWNKNTNLYTEIMLVHLYSITTRSDTFVTDKR